MKIHQNFLLAFLKKKKIVNKSFASSNIYFTSENFPLINEDGDKSNSLDWILSSLETKSSKSILSVRVLKLHHEFLWKVLSRSNIGANVSSEGRKVILRRKIKTWNRFQLFPSYRKWVWKIKTFWIILTRNVEMKLGPIQSDFHTLTERRFYGQIAFRTPFPK